MKKVTVCGVNIADFTLVIPAISQSAEKTAAEFLKRVIEASCGVKLPVSDTKTAHSIILGSRERDSRIKWDGFRTATDENHLYLHGNIPRGTLYAAYDFAEKYLGYRLFAADPLFGDNTEVISDDGESNVPSNLELIDNPVFQTRQVNWLAARNDPEYAALCRFNTLDGTGDFGGTSPRGGCHTFSTLCPPDRYFEEHPEYYSYIPDEEKGGGRYIAAGNVFGEECGQLCLTNPDVLRIVTDNVLTYLRAHPECEIVDVSQDDNVNYCRCERCAAVDTEEESHAGTLIRFVNAIGEAVEKEFPHVLIHTLAYTYTKKAPKLTKARHNVLVRYCTFEACYRHSIHDPHCESNRDLAKNLTEWQQRAENLSIWNYITNYRCYMAPFPDLYANRENIRFFADCHAIHLYEDGSCEGGAGKITYATGAYGELKMYLIGKLMWNPYLSDDEFNGHIREFLRAYYGKGWEDILAYIRLEHEATEEAEIGCFAPVDISTAFSSDDLALREYLYGEYEAKAYQPPNRNNVLKKLCDRLDEAKALFDAASAKAETEEQKRHIDRSRMAIDYLELFCTRHDKNTMTDEEKAIYEAACAEFLRRKNEYNFHYNIWTQRYNKK